MPIGKDHNFSFEHSEWARGDFETSTLKYPLGSSEFRPVAQKHDLWQRYKFEYHWCIDNSNYGNWSHVLRVDFWLTSIFNSWVEDKKLTQEAKKELPIAKSRRIKACSQRNQDQKLFNDKCVCASSVVCRLIIKSCALWLSVSELAWFFLEQSRATGLPVRSCRGELSASFHLCCRGDGMLHLGWIYVLLAVWGARNDKAKETKKFLRFSSVMSFVTFPKTFTI